MAVRMADFCALAGLRVVARSSLRPLAIWFSSSSWVRRMLVVVQACVGIALCHRAGGRWRAVVDGNGRKR